MKNKDLIGLWKPKLMVIFMDLRGVIRRNKTKI
jgi:hypothetical protein